MTHCPLQITCEVFWDRTRFSVFRNRGLVVTYFYFQVWPLCTIGIRSASTVPYVGGES